MKIGEILKTEREKRELSVYDIEEGTRIRAKYILALEEEDYDEIPGEAYIVGFLRNYALFLETDPEPLIQQYRYQSKNDNHTSQLVVAEEPVNTSSSSKIKTFLGVAVLVVVVFSGSFIYFNSREQSVTPPPKPPISQEQIDVEAKPTPPPAPIEEKMNIKLIGNQNCWTRVYVDGTVAFEGTIISGETKDFEAEESIRVRLGNAGGVDVIYNGEKEQPLGKQGQVVEKEYTKSI